MRIAPLALVALMAISVPAFAEETVSTFTIRFTSNDAGALQDLESLPMTVRRGWAHLAKGDRWDTQRYGAFDAVVEHSEFVVSAPLPGEATVRVSIAPTTPVPSESVSAQALAARLLEIIEADVAERLAGWRERSLLGQRASADASARRALEADVRATVHRKRWGDVATEHKMSVDRLREAASDLARTRVDLAVAARRLLATQAAAERAAEVEQIRRRADEIERKLDSKEWRDADEASAMRATLEALRDALTEAQKKAPALDDVRRTAFDLEVETVGLEARRAALEPEIHVLRKRVIELVGAAAEARGIESALDAARTAERAKSERLRELELKLSRVAVVVVSAPTPGAHK